MSEQLIDRAKLQTLMLKVTTMEKMMKQRIEKVKTSLPLGLP